MDEPYSYLWKVMAIGALVLANAFFVATEFALVGARRSRMEALALSGNRHAKTVLRATADLDRYIAGTQVGITLASLALGWIGESVLEHALGRLFGFLSPVFIQSAAPAITAFIVITFLHVVFGELVPKSIALQNPDKAALRLASPMRLAVLLLSPLIWALNSTGNIFLRLLGLRTGADAHGKGMIQSLEELKILVEDSHRHGVLDENERLMLHRVFKMKHLTARQVMVHRLDIVGMPVEMPFKGLMLAVVDAPHSRFPVYRDDLDHIVGILYVKDIIGYRKREEDFDLESIVRPALFVPETIGVEALLAQFKRSRTQMAIVLDEFGGTSGLVTLEDVVEELLGELDEEEVPTNGLSLPTEPSHLSGPIEIDGRTRLDVLNERFGLALEEDDIHTIAGFVVSRLGKLPDVGERVKVDGFSIVVSKIDGPRIVTLSLEPLKKVDDAQENRNEASPDEPSG